MKLYDLYTEDQLSEAGNPFKNLMHYAGKAFGRAKTTPNPREIQVKKIIQEVYEEIWGDYHDDPKALGRIDQYKSSISRHMPEFLRVQDKESLRLEIETMFRARAERIAFQDPSWDQRQ